MRLYRNQTIKKLYDRCSFASVVSCLILCFFSCSLFLSFSHAQRYEQDIDITVDTRGSDTNPELPQSLKDYLETDILSPEGGATGIRDLLITIGVQILIPVFVFAGIIIAILGFYKLMTSEAEEDTAKARDYITYGVLGVVIMVSAGYLTNLLVGIDGTGGGSSIFDFEGRDELNGTQLAAEAYNTIVYPFVRLFLIVAMGVLFIIVLVNALRLMFSPDEDIQSKATSILMYAVVGVLVLLLSKTIVELVYGSYDKVIGEDKITDLSEVGILFGDVGAEGEALVRVRAVINRVLGLATFIVMMIIIYLGYMLLFQPNDEEKLKNIKQYFVYMIIGIFIIGMSYILSRMLLVTG